MIEARKKKIITRLEAISEDMERDVKAFEGQPFNGRTVSTWLGYQAAAINALAKSMKEILEASDEQP